MNLQKMSAGCIARCLLYGVAARMKNRIESQAIDGFDRFWCPAIQGAQPDSQPEAEAAIQKSLQMLSLRGKIAAEAP